MNITKTKRIFYPLSLLIIPLIGTIFSNQVNWSVFDFLIMGTLLLLLGIGINVTIEKVKNKQLRIIPITLLVLLFLILWAELAVGIFGSPFAGS